jgi:hypothetical protein
MPHAADICALLIRRFRPGFRYLLDFRQLRLLMMILLTPPLPPLASFRHFTLMADEH